MTAGMESSGLVDLAREREDTVETERTLEMLVERLRRPRRGLEGGSKSSIIGWAGGGPGGGMGGGIQPRGGGGG